MRRGFVYAPVVGILLLGIAFIVAGYIFSQEKSSIGVLSEKKSELRYVGYAEVSAYDIRSSFVADLRTRLINDLTTYRVDRLLEDFQNNVTRWFSNVFNELRRYYTEENVMFDPPRDISGSVTRYGDDYLLTEIRGHPLEVKISRGGRTVTLFVDVNTVFSVPFPLQAGEINQTPDITLGLLDLEGIPLGDTRREVVGKIKEALEEALEQMGDDCEVESVNPTFESEDVLVVDVEGGDIEMEEESAVRFIRGFSYSLVCEWTVPGFPDLRKRVILNFEDDETYDLWSWGGVPSPGSLIVLEGEYYFPLTVTNLPPNPDDDTLRSLFLEQILGKSWTQRGLCGCIEDVVHHRLDCRLGHHNIREELREACEKACQLYRDYLNTEFNDVVCP